MPTSRLDSTVHVMNVVLTKHYRERKIESVLDVGIGWGKYGLLMREYLSPFDIMKSPEDWGLRLDGIEVFEGYIKPYTQGIYSNIWITDIRDFCKDPFQWNEEPYWDLVLLLDIIEHLPKKEGLEVLRELSRYTRSIVVLTPIEMMIQPAHRFHELEQHVSVWDFEDFMGFEVESVVHQTEFLLLILKGEWWEDELETDDVLWLPSDKKGEQHAIFSD